MSPVHDPRWSEARKRETVEASRTEYGREWLIPLIMLVVGAAIMMVVTYAAASGEESRVPRAALVATYPIFLAIEVAFGVAGLWLAATLWMGGAGTLGMAILRLAAIYAVTDVLGLIVAPLYFLGWFVIIIVYIGLLMWQFELEFREAIVLALITWLLKIGAAFLLTVAFLSG